MIASEKILAAMFGQPIESQERSANAETARCRCGKVTNRNDLKFWGECLDCRIHSQYSPSPARSACNRTNAILLAERQYHGERTQHGD